ncbi:MAG: Hsp20/alpha crystallin family protein [Armatimonadota bacterium]|nr:Hsp20/alpha crystallin family protein [Armatimonadota bacterium]MDW8156358.1 Hsp20/alpha crystallin family protein [Armatimonadota bacterium]
MLSRWNRWDPFEEIRAIQREISNLFDRVLGTAEAALTSGARSAEWVPPMEAFYHGGALVLRCFLPGVDPKSVDVTVTDNVLTIRGERRLGLDVPRDDYLFSEVAYGRFDRTLTLPQHLKMDQASARYEHGVLEIRIPVVESALPRKVNVEVAAPAEKVLAGAAR